MRSDFEKTRQLRDFLNQELARIGSWDWAKNSELRLPVYGEIPKALVTTDKITRSPDFQRFKYRRLNFQFAFTEIPVPCWLIECDGLVVDAGLMIDDPNPQHTLQTLIGTAVDSAMFE